jgi:pilus assembly protein Flp/PilA
MLLKAYVALITRLTTPLQRDDRGASAVEYALLVALIAVAIVVTMTALGAKISGMFTTVTNDI